jgi:hypothetical protein
MGELGSPEEGTGGTHTTASGTRMKRPTLVVSKHARVQELRKASGAHAQRAAALEDACRQAALDVSKYGGARPRLDGGVKGMDEAQLAVADIMHNA